jgi:2-polyprenyl-3-methyl-5-hydroxy-6-metoxy-1,4-benzoquinol methylase
MLIKFGKLNQSYYKGIFEKAAFGLHSAIIKIVLPHLKPGSRVLDVGCGEGAFSQRLIDQGMTVDVCDIDIDQVKATPNQKIKIDINRQDFSSHFSQKYNAAFGIEIIEHIESPWKFVRDLISVIEDDGLLVISTPNVSSFPSRLRFLMKGRLLAFEKNDLAHGHITPMPYFQLEHIFSECGLSIISKGHGGVIPFFHFADLSRFSLLRNTILPLMYPLMGGPKKGRALIYVLKKSSARNKDHISEIGK